MTNLVEAAINESPHARTNGHFRVLTPTVCSILAGIGVFGGILALVLGLFSTIMHGIVPEDTVFDNVGTIFMILGIPLLLLGSVFLDKIKQ